jgi:hypothetical protein
MVKVRCLRCGGRADGDTPAEASMRIDHSIGLGIGKPCLGYPKAPTEVVEKGTEQPKEKPPVEIKAKVAELKSEDKPKPKKKSTKKD